MIRERTFRYNSEAESEKDFVYRVICYTSKNNGKRYTLTILPHFLLPGCLVRADDIFSAGTNNDLREDINKICQALGVIDERTARKHIARFDECANTFTVHLSGIISKYEGELPEKKPDGASPAETNIDWLEKLGAEVIRIREKLFGYEALSLKDIAAMYFFFQHPAYPCATINENLRNICYQFF